MSFFGGFGGGKNPNAGPGPSGPGGPGLPSRQPPGSYGGGYGGYGRGTTRDELMGGGSASARNELFDAAPRQQRQPPRASPAPSAASQRDVLMGGAPQRKPIPQQLPQQSPPHRQTPSITEKNQGLGAGEYSQDGGKGRALQLQQTTLPKPYGDELIFRDLVGVSSQDFPPGPGREIIYLLFEPWNMTSRTGPAPMGIKYAVTAKPMDEVKSGCYVVNEFQRNWMQITPGCTSTVQEYDPFHRGGNAYLASMDIQVAFARRSSAHSNPINADELEAGVASLFRDHIFAPGQIILYDHRGAKYKLTVKTVTLVDLSLGQQSEQEPTDEPVARGILIEHPSLALNFFKDVSNGEINLKSSSKRRAAANAIIAPDFKFDSLGIGGLDEEFSVIFRRAFASRIFPPGLVEKLGLPHVKGMLLFGPPGTGKTLIARQIGKMLNAREPKVINGPEVLNKYVGQSEENIRKMFGDAEKEYKEKGEESGLHIIIFDELDAVCKQRGSTSGGTGVGDSVVNQLLSKLDGVNQLNNILLIGMTNRKDMIDDALLRPGRLEVQIEIGLPDEHGRNQILNIHTSKLKGNDVLADDVDIPRIAKETKNFSGAEIAGLVRSATSFAMNRHVTANAQLKDDVDNLIVNMADFEHALSEVKPAFGAPESETESVIRRGIIHYNDAIESIITRARKYWDNSPISISQPGSVNNILLHGPPKSGTTALAAHLATLSGYPYVKMITLGKLSNMRDEFAKADHIAKVFSDAYKSPYSVVILDEIDLLFEYVPVGPRFSNHLLSVLKGKMKETPPKGHRLLVLSTTCNFSIMEMLDFRRAFSTTIQVPVVETTEELWKVLQEAGPFQDPQDVNEVYQILNDTHDGKVGLGIKLLLEEAFIARGSDGKSAGQDFSEVVGAAINERMLSSR